MKNCSTEDIKSNDDETSVAIKSALVKYMKRTLENLDEKEKIDNLKEVHGNKIKFQLIYKVEYNGAQFYVSFDYTYVSNEILLTLYAFWVLPSYPTL